MRSERWKSHFQGPIFQHFPGEDTPGPPYLCEILELCISQPTRWIHPCSLNISKISDRSSTYIRKSLLDMEWEMSWLIHPSDIDIQSSTDPDCLNRFVLGVLTTGATNPSKRAKNLSASFSQDIAYAVTCGETKTPKQFLL